MDNTLNFGKNVFAVYGRDIFAEWSEVLYNLDCDDTTAVDESKSINLFLKKHPGITGFLLYGFEPDVIIYYHRLNTYNYIFFRN